MQIPTTDMGSEALIDLALWHKRTLELFDETRPLAAPLGEHIAALEGRAGSVRETRRAQIEPRVAVAHANLAADVTLRQLAAALREQDGGKPGRASKAIFPDGLTPIVTPVAGAQAAALTTLVQRLEANRALGAVVVRFLPIARGDLERLNTALSRRLERARAHGAARAEEVVAREMLVAVYQESAGKIWALYPHDRDRREFFFDRFRGAARGDEDSQRVAVDADAPAAVPAPVL